MIEELLKDTDQKRIYRIEGDTCIVTLYYKGQAYECYFDKEDERIYLARGLKLNSYANNNKFRVAIYRKRQNKWYDFNVARLLLNYSGPLQVDHIDDNSLNNRKNNLRLVTNQDNSRNKKSYRNSTSKYKGVSWNTKGQKWYVQICIDNKRKYLGYFTNEQDAAQAYDDAIRPIFGKFGRYNFPQDGEQSALR